MPVLPYTTSWVGFPVRMMARSIANTWATAAQVAFYAIGHLDGLELHLKQAPKNQAERQHRHENDHLDASAGVAGIEAFYEQCVANQATILKPLAHTAWGTKDFYVEDPDGYIICFGGS
jgi:uncharacterized glyoxalase superfamily protein PhnB